MSDSLWSHGLYSLWILPGHNTGVGSLSFLQGIFPTQGSNPGLPHCRQILYQLSYKGSPRILEWVAYSFSSGSSQSRNPTGVSCIAGWFCTNWAIREATKVKVNRIIEKVINLLLPQLFFFWNFPIFLQVSFFQCKPEKESYLRLFPGWSKPPSWNNI